jgi:RNase_H superfamily
MTNFDVQLLGATLLLVLALFILGKRIFGRRGSEPTNLDAIYKPYAKQPLAALDSQVSTIHESSTERPSGKENSPVQVRLEDVSGEIYLDIETLRLSSEVSGGWGSIDKFGVAVAITWDLKNEYRSWFEADVLKLIEELRRFERIVTYNGDRFDFVVLSGYGEIRGLAARSFDVLSSISSALGHRVKLDKVASDTLGVTKDGDGLDAVRWWRQGERDRVIEYCKKDVDLLIGIVAHGRMHGHFKAGGRKIMVDWNPHSAMLTRRSRGASRKAKGVGTNA